MTEAKRNPNPFIRMNQQANLAKEKKIEIAGLLEKTNHIGTNMPKNNSAPRTTKVMRKAGRGS
jgi:hypothetical protein